MTLIPAATVLWYLLLAKFAITGGRALVYAFSAGALIAILILHMSILALFQTRFVFLVGLPLFLLIGLPIYGIIIPFIAVTLANVHISGSAIKQRSTQQSDLVEISSDLKGSSVQNRNHYQGTTIEFKTEPRKDSFLTNIDTARTLLKPLHLSAMSVESPTINQRNETLPLYRPTNFDENKPQILPRKSTTQPTSPISASRANSVARSDYSSSYAMSKNYGRVSSYKASRMTARSSKYNSRFAETDTQQHSTIFSKEEIREEIRFILQDSDLNSVSRREIKEHLFVQFGESVEIYSEFINSCIEEFTLEKLALL
jgi:hypothetical protein